VSPGEVAAIARSNTGIDWTVDGCTDFVWGVTNLAGAPFFDLRDNTTNSDPLDPQDIFYVVPHSPGIVSGTDDMAGDGWLPAYAGSSVADMLASLQVGDVVRVYASGNTAEASEVGGSYAAHSFIVSQIDGGTISVVDNWNSGTIIEHHINDIVSTFAVNGQFHAAFASRIDQTYVDQNFGSDTTGNGFGDFTALSATGAGVSGYQFIGTEAYDYAGFSVSSAGDVDGDGKDDLIIGAVKAPEAAAATEKPTSFSRPTSPPPMPPMAAWMTRAGGYAIALA
jgi:hypothetical protein